ncbi:MAG: hypothetical protein ABIY50_12240 [Ignavibacteria bacterium]
MIITKKILADKILHYLQHKITLSELVDWAENATMKNAFEEKDFDIIDEIVSAIGLADVKAFGLTWEDCEKYLNKLGYRVKVEAEAV